MSLQVSDLQRSLEYYQRVLGLRALDSSGNRALLGAADGHAIVQLVERRGARRVPRRGLLGLYHFAVLLPDRAALGRFLRHLAEIGVQAGMSDHLVSEAIYLQDPDNLGIEVYADRPRPEWRVDPSGQLSMSTAPLDVQSVLAAGGTQAWSGAPAGTRLGHVHLHVGDIDEAARFYHEGVGFDNVVWSYPGALFMSAGGYHHHLGVNTWAEGAPSASEQDARLLEWEIVVPGSADVEAAAAHLRRAHAVQREGSDAIAHDPWGTTLRLRAEPG